MGFDTAVNESVVVEAGGPGNPYERAENRPVPHGPASAPEGAALCRGQVLFSNEGIYMVRTDLGDILCEKAVSCLVQPLREDFVLLSVENGRENFILSVLRRPHRDHGTDLLFDGQVNLHVRDGALSVISDKALSLASRESVQVVSETIQVHANSGRAQIERFSFLGRRLQSQVKRVKLIAGSMEHICRRFTQRLQDSFRFVKEHDETQSGSSRIVVEDTLTMHTRNSVIQAEELVKIDAGQIHLG